MMRIGSLLMLLVVMGMMYARARDPDTWRWIAADSSATTRPTEPANQDSPALAKPAKSDSSPALADLNETVVDGPNETDPEEQEAFNEAAQAVSDNQPLLPEEMFAYWRLFDWARASPFADIWSRARKDVLFAQLFDQPQLHRGELVSLNLHVRRVLPHPPDPRETDRPAVYEAWGATDDSRTFPYCVVFPDKPPSLPTGDGIEEEARFAGYFLKVMRYEDKLGKVRGAPLLIGRIQWRETPGRAELARAQSQSPWTFWIVAAGFAAFLILRWALKPKGKPVGLAGVAPTDEHAVNAWFDEAEHNDGDVPPPQPSSNGNSRSGH